MLFISVPLSVSPRSIWQAIRRLRCRFWLAAASASALARFWSRPAGLERRPAWRCSCRHAAWSAAGSEICSTGCCLLWPRNVSANFFKLRMRHSSYLETYRLGWPTESCPLGPFSSANSRRLSPRNWRPFCRTTCTYYHYYNENTVKFRQAGI